jgi:hypothetical protein
MAVISSSVGGQAASQAALQQLRVQQAKQNAERAEYAAQTLRAQADAAQSESDRAQENARSLYTRSDQAQSAVGVARQGLAAMESRDKMQVQLSNTVEQVSGRVNVPEPGVILETGASKEVAKPPAVVNTSGQMIGTVVNVTA